MPIIQAYQNLHTQHAYSHTHTVESRSRITHFVNALRSRIALMLHVHNKLARHAQHTHITHAHQKHTQLAYLNTRRRITLTHRVHASRSSIALTLHVHDKARTSLTHNASQLYTRIKSSTHHTHIRTHTPWNHADASRSRIAFPHHVHASRLRSTFMIILARHTQRTHITHSSHRSIYQTTRRILHIYTTSDIARRRIEDVEDSLTSTHTHALIYTPFYILYHQLPSFYLLNL
jgi:hypothetical protein